jgi:hypothetical protein
MPLLEAATRETHKDPVARPQPVWVACSHDSKEEQEMNLCLAKITSGSSTSEMEGLNLEKAKASMGSG